MRSQRLPGRHSSSGRLNQEDDDDVDDVYDETADDDADDENTSSAINVTVGNDLRKRNRRLSIFEQRSISRHLRSEVV